MKTGDEVVVANLDSPQCSGTAKLVTGSDTIGGATNGAIDDGLHFVERSCTDAQHINSHVRKLVVIFGQNLQAICTLFYRA
jgi:hypothetical protein